jgi:tetratricopeptide (TPR) repeat protein
VLGILLRSAAAILIAVAAAHGAQIGTRDPAALGAAGWTAIDEKRFGDALEAFASALRSRKNDPALYAGAGLAAFMLGQNDEAQTWLEGALKLAPQYADVSLLLGELHYREGRVEEAIATYETALKYSPSDSTFETKLAKWRADARVRASSYESRGAHFRVLFQGPADEMIARRAVELLEGAYWRVGGVLTRYPDGAMPVVLYTQEQFRDVTRSPEWAAGSYDGTIRIPMRGALEHPEELDRVLTHEFVHAIVATIGGPRVPAWLNEGLASVLEPAGGVAYTFQDRTRPAMPLTRLERGFAGMSAQDARSAYALSAAAVRKMMQLRGAYAIVSLLEDLGRGVSFEGAFQQRMALRYEEFQAIVERE